MNMNDIAAPLADLKKGESRQAQLFRIASTLFAARGFSGTRIADIAEAADISLGLIYRYFASKEALYVALIADSLHMLENAALALEAAHYPAEAKLRFALVQLVERLEHDRDFCERVLIVAQAALTEELPESARALLQAEREKLYRIMARLIAAGQADGAVLGGEPRELAVLFWILVKGMALHRQGLGLAARLPSAELLIRAFLVSAEAA